VNLPSVAFHRCPSCGPSLFAKLAADDIGIRCLRCFATPVTLSLIDVLRSRVSDLPVKEVYEMSSRGPLVRYLERHAARLTRSEYFDDTALGDFKRGVQCQDATRLTYPDCSFDLCTSTEVFEHVADDQAAFGEMHRVLRPGGMLMFTVPIGNHPTTTRARLESGRLVHIEPPEYHSDRLRGAGKVFCYRNYGTDLDTILLARGFSHAELAWPRQRWFGIARRVAVARKGAH
jgi:SAM-dependent methyltransferase